MRVHVYVNRVKCMEKNMWFKQLSFYPLNKNNLPEVGQINKALADAVFGPCTGLDWFAEGFASAVSFDDALVFSANNSHRIALKKEEKVLPSAVIKDILDEKISLIEQEEARSIGRKEKMTLKEQITDDLLPRAFTKSSRSQAIFDYDRGYLIINSATANKAEAMLSKVRQALGGLEAKLPHTELSPSALMTDWLLTGAAAGNFELDSSCVQQGTGPASPIIRMAKLDLTEEEVVNHAKNGKIVTELGLMWNERVRFTLTQDLALKRIQYLDIIQDEANEHGDDLASLSTASQIIMTETLGAMIDELIGHLGGLQVK